MGMEIISMDRLLEEYIDTDMLDKIDDSDISHPSFQTSDRFLDASFLRENDISGIESMLNRDAESAWHKAPPKCDQVRDLVSADDSPPKSSRPEKEALLDECAVSGSEYLPAWQESPLCCVSQPPTPRTRNARLMKSASLFHEQDPKLSEMSLNTSSILRLKQSPSCFSNEHDIASPCLSSELRQTGNGLFPQACQPFPNTDFAFQDYKRHIQGGEYMIPRPLLQRPLTVGVSSTIAGLSNDALDMTSSVPELSAAISALCTPSPSLSHPATRWQLDTPPELDLALPASSDFAVGLTMADSWNDDGAQHHPHCEIQSLSVIQGIHPTNETGHGLGISCDSLSLTESDWPQTRFGAGNEVYGALAWPLAVNDFDVSQPALQKRHATLPEYIPRSTSLSPVPRSQSYRHRSVSNTHSSRRNRRKCSNPSSLPCRHIDGDSMGFVNFTPDDRRKLLTGVAPSGSNKTKARREKEAADKRRRLSRAAVKAVIDAGGDIDSLKGLENEELLVLEA